MNPLFDLVRVELHTLLLAITRSAGLILVAPLPWHYAPKRIRAVLAIVLGYLGHSLSPVGTGTTLSVERTVLCVVGELMLGVALGLTVRFAVAIAEVAAELIAPMLGIGVAQMFDPATHVQQNEVGIVLRHLAVVLALLVGLHRVLLGGLLESFSLLPVGGLIQPGRMLPTLLASSSSLLETGVRVALPVTAVLFMTQIALAFIARSAPALQVFAVGFSVTLVIGCLTLIGSLPDMAYEFVSAFSHVGRELEQLLEAAMEPRR